MVAITPHISPNRSMPSLARALLQAGRLSITQIETLDKTHKENNESSRFIDTLLAAGYLNPDDLALFCAETFGYPLLDLTAWNADLLPEKIIDTKLMVSEHVMVLAKRGNKIFITISDPTNTQVVDQIKFQTELMVVPIIVEHPALLKHIQKIASSADDHLHDMIGDDQEINFVEDDSAAAADASNIAEIDDAPTVRFLQKLLLDAINQNASDLHFEPFEKFYRIRFRIDGVLRDIAQPPVAIKNRLASRIKVLSRLDISEKRVPQDGCMRLMISQNRTMDFRVSTLPTLFGEKIVMRILDASQAQTGIDALGYDPDQKAVLLQAIKRPYGMVLVTGPTGSGKTVSLYTCLNTLNQPGMNISTIEDPAEINLPGINQVNINERAGLTFPVALKAFLRQDPDIIMVGEIRDLETADISIKAAQTGHMVLSTLHTNDAPSTLTRLMNMGVPAFNIASSVILISAQRLVRRLCVCKQAIVISDQTLIEAGFTKDECNTTWMPYQAVGCDFCGGSGYKGRTGIYQIMPISENIERIILAHGSTLEIETQARLDGVYTLRESGLIKVKQGLTSLEEVLACTNI